MTNNETMSKAAIAEANISERDIARFHSKITKTEGCWEWNCWITTGGYGAMHVKGVNIRAHRMSYVIHKGSIPPGMFVCHHCDNPKCVRPDHLFVGTPLDNVRDGMAKGRVTYPKRYVPRRADWVCEYIGDIHKSSVLTSEQVAEIKSTPRFIGSGRKLAAKFGVHESTISAVLRGKSWRHIPSPTALKTK